MNRNVLFERKYRKSYDIAKKLEFQLMTSNKLRIGIQHIDFCYVYKIYLSSFFLSQLMLAKLDPFLQNLFALSIYI